MSWLPGEATATKAELFFPADGEDRIILGRSMEAAEEDPPFTGSSSSGRDGSSSIRRIEKALEHQGFFIGSRQPFLARLCSFIR